MNYGYLYCLSNQSLIGILNIGITEKSPKDILNQANTFDIWRPPTPYKIEFAKKVYNPYQKKQKIHYALKEHRIHSDLEFFRVSSEEVRNLFDLPDGEIWKDNDDNEDNEDNSSDDNDDNDDNDNKDDNEDDSSDDNDDNEDDNDQEPKSLTKAPGVKGCRDMTKCFKNGQLIRHTISMRKDTWIGKYNSLKNVIIYNNKEYESLSGFTGDHYRIVYPERGSNSNGWAECEYYINKKWCSTFCIYY
jgi:hypothetical protein